MKKGKTMARAGLAALAMAAALASAPAPAQVANEDQVDRGRRIFRDVANCKYCHGWDGKSALVEGYPSPPSLVNTILDKEAVIEAVACGRPRPGMPRHFEEAWTPKYKCYGMVKEEIGNDYPDVPQKRFLTLEEIGDVAAFVIAVFKPGDMTFENCQKYYAPVGGSKLCDQFKK